MKVLLLPGMSSHNKEWAEETKLALAPDIDVDVVDWPHWDGGEPAPDWIQSEAEKLLAYAGSFSILAKSIGSLVAVTALSKNPELVDKLILCGLPLSGIEQSDKEKYQVLAKLDPKKVMIIQNKNDHVASHADAVAFVSAITADIQVAERDRNDHSYPYPEDFKQFFLS